MNVQNIIKGLKKKDSRIQKELYARYAALMLAICRRYLFNKNDAEDAMISGFYKIMTKIDQYSGEGHFEAWMRRIMVNECLMLIRKNKRNNITVELSDLNQGSFDENVLDRIAVKEIFDYLDELPQGYRTVLNLYAIEGYKHREIAELLGISINTSKSQLLLARKKLILIYNKKNSIGLQNGTE